MAFTTEERIRKLLYDVISFRARVGVIGRDRAARIISGEIDGILNALAVAKLENEKLQRDLNAARLAVHAITGEDFSL